MVLVYQQMMLQIQKKQSYNITLKKTFILKSLVVFFATGLFANTNNIENRYISNNKNKNLLLKPIKALSDEEYDRFILGRSFFTIPWVEAPSATTARDGLGPLFNANTCISCHPKNGAGILYTKKGLVSRSLIARLSQESNNSIKHQNLIKYHGFVPETTYGSQLAINGVHEVPFEGKIKVDFEEIKVKFYDGEEQILLKPKYSLENLNYGKLHKSSNISYRMAPSLNGMGLISLIPDELILANEDIKDSNKDGISGKANWVYSKITNKYDLGKYTWKASVAFLKEQVANAASNDLGLTTTINPKDSCTKEQEACLKAPKSRHSIDLPDERLEAVTFYIKNLRTYSAKKDKKYYKGLELFKQVGCASCHIPSFKGKKGFEISPFSDFLLHDMGESLADGRVEFKAEKNEFRTAPLWGLALHEKINKKAPRLLHDGRARTYQEAILWHGGEAQRIKEIYMALPKNKREELLQFLKDL